jgi:hypothetical protein
MEAPELEGDLREEVDALKERFHLYDYFFVHVKKVDSHGEDGNFGAKKNKIEEVDTYIPAGNPVPQPRRPDCDGRPLHTRGDGRAQLAPRALSPEGSPRAWRNVPGLLRAGVSEG